MRRSPPIAVYGEPMVCAWCRSAMGYVHGHAACLDGSCPMFGVNQAECCDGETAETGPAPTSIVAGDRIDSAAPRRLN